MSPGKLVVKEDVKETEILFSERNIKFLEIYIECFLPLPPTLFVIMCSCATGYKPNI